jgi:hypothetical protein
MTGEIHDEPQLEIRANVSSEIRTVYLPNTVRQVNETCLMPVNVSECNQHMNVINSTKRISKVIKAIHVIGYRGL